MIKITAFREEEADDETAAELNTFRDKFLSDARWEMFQDEDGTLWRIDGGRWLKDIWGRIEHSALYYVYRWRNDLRCWHYLYHVEVPDDL